MNEKELKMMEERVKSDAKLLSQCGKYRMVEGMDNPVLFPSSSNKLYFSRELEIRDQLGRKGASLEFPHSFPPYFKFKEDIINFVIVKKENWSDVYGHKNTSMHLIGSLIKSKEEVVYLFRYNKLNSTGKFFPSAEEERKAKKDAEEKAEEDTPELLRGGTLHFKYKDSLQEEMFEHQTFQIISSGKMKIIDGMVKFYDFPDNNVQEEIKEYFSEIKIKFIGESESA